MYDILIIGAGPAGLSAGIYAGRGRFSTAILTGMHPGGLLSEAAKVANYPGFPEAVSGMELMDKMTAQAENSGASFIYASATSITRGDSAFSVICEGLDTPLESRAIILAPGTRHRKAGLPGEQELAGHGLSYCAVCDAPFYRDKVISVLGSNDKAASEALLLCGNAREVHLLCHRDRLMLRTESLERLQQTSNLTLHFNVTPKSFHANAQGRLSHIRYEQSGELRELACDGLFVAIGVEPETAFLARTGIELDSAGYINTKPFSSATSVPGVFAAGDCVHGAMHQAIIAAGMGAAAALEAMQFLKN